MYAREELEALVAHAIGCNMLAQDGGGFLSVMAGSTAAIQKHIPAAFEMYTLLEHYLKTLPIRHEMLAFGANPLALEPGIVVGHDAGKVRDGHSHSGLSPHHPPCPIALNSPVLYSR